MKQEKKLNNSEKMIASLQKQDLAHANKYFERALTNDTEEELLELADYLESIGFFPQAKQIYENLAPHYPESYISLAQIASEDGQVEEAFAYLEEITSDSDWYVTALLVKADLYQMEGLPDVAREKLAEAKQLSDEPLVTFGLAEIDFELGNFNKALEIEYDDAVAFELATILYDQKEYQKANLYFKQIDTISPEFESYEYGYALSLHAEHQTEEALRLTQQGLSKNPFDTRLLLLASQLSYELHDEQKAEDYLLKAKDNAEDLEEIALRLSNLYLEQERFDEVLKFEEQDIDNVLTKWNIARAYQALEQTTAALERYRLLLSDLKENPEFLEQYIYLLREMGDFEEAKHQAEYYLHLVPDDMEMQELYDSL